MSSTQSQTLPPEFVREDNFRRIFWEVGLGWGGLTNIFQELPSFGATADDVEFRLAKYDAKILLWHFAGYCYRDGFSPTIPGAIVRANDQHCTLFVYFEYAAGVGESRLIHWPRIQQSLFAFIVGESDDVVFLAEDHHLLDQRLQKSIGNMLTTQMFPYIFF